MHTLLQLPHPPRKHNTSYLCFKKCQAAATPNGRLQSYNLYVIGGTLAQVGRYNEPFEHELDYHRRILVEIIYLL